MPSIFNRIAAPFIRLGGAVLNRISPPFVSLGKTFLGPYYDVISIGVKDAKSFNEQFVNLTDHSTEFKITANSYIYALDINDDKFKQVRLFNLEENSAKLDKRDPDSLKLKVITANKGEITYSLRRAYLKGKPVIYKDEANQEATLFTVDIVLPDKYLHESNKSKEYVTGIYIYLNKRGNKIYPELANPPYSSNPITFKITENISFPALKTVQNSVDNAREEAGYRPNNPMSDKLMNFGLKLVNLACGIITWVTFIIPIRIGLGIVVIACRLLLPLPFILLNTLGCVIKGLWSKKNLQGIREGWNASGSFNSKLFSLGILGYLNKEILQYDILEQNLQEAKVNHKNLHLNPWKLIVAWVINIPVNLVKAVVRVVFSIGLLLNCTLRCITQVILGCFTFTRESNYHFVLAKESFSNTIKKIKQGWQDIDFPPLITKPTSTNPQRPIDENKKVKEKSIFYDLRTIKKSISYALTPQTVTTTATSSESIPPTSVDPPFNIEPSTPRRQSEVETILPGRPNDFSSFAAKANKSAESKVEDLPRRV